MQEILKNKPTKLEFAVLDENGDFVPSLNITFEIRQSSTNNLIHSGTMANVGSVYTTEVTLTSVGSYRAVFITPANYENGFLSLSVVEDYLGMVEDIRDEALGKMVLNPTAKTLTLYRVNGTVFKVFDLTTTTNDVPTIVGRTPI